MTLTRHALTSSIKKVMILQSEKLTAIMKTLIRCIAKALADGRIRGTF